MPAVVLGVRAELQPKQQPVVSPVIQAAYASVPAVPPPAPAPKTDELPSVAVAPFAVHAVPSEADTMPAQPYMIVPLDRPVDHRVIERRVAERSLPKAPRALRRHAVPVSTGPVRLSGPAEAAGGVALRIDGQFVRLFGVALARSSDDAAARVALARRIAASPVTCDAPPGQTGTLSYVCRDRAGVDLGERLVAEGFAIADRSRSYQYVSDEEAARAKRVGLWSGR